ncbi:hypothetical protein [Azospirillum argentinense]|uniref:hypothetical protein n=1 Tax=Azospirillum argentinense TaxID=2970906 RepID=UPI0032DE7ADC
MMDTKATVKTSPERIKAALKVLAEQALAKAEASGSKRRAAVTRFAAEQAIEHDNFEFIRGLMNGMKRIPVTIDQFIEDPDYLGQLITVWPALRDDLRAINPDVFTGAPPVHEALLGGATGTGKSEVIKITVAYQAYCFSCWESPQRLFGLNPTTQIMFPLQSVSRAVTDRALYKPLRQMMTNMPFARRFMTWDRRKESALEFESNLQIVPALAALNATIGSAVPCAGIDEVNFMQVIMASSKAAGAGGQGGKWDQAEEVYSNLSRRRESRFATRGYSLGVLVLASSTRYKDDFLDRRIDQAVRTDEKGVVHFRHRQFEVQPAEKFSAERFRLLVGTDDYPTRILEPWEREGEHYPPGAHVENVPENYRAAFHRDPDNALRDIVGVATAAITPFLPQRDKILGAIERGKAAKLIPWVNKEVVDLAVDGMPQVLEENLPPLTERKLPHYVHVDLAISGDRCGIAFARQLGNVAVEEQANVFTMAPAFAVPLAVALTPSTMRHVDLSEVRAWIMRFASEYGINIAGVSYDGFQSRDSVQQLRKAGVRAWEISVDRTMEPYEYLRTALYQSRVALPDNELLRVELVKLEHVKARNKVDHPPRGSKDIADAVCGAIYQASQAPEIRYGAALVDSDGQRLRSPRARPERVRLRPAGRERPLGRAR